MKKLLLIFLISIIIFITFLVFSCKQEDNSATANVTASNLIILPEVFK